MPKVTLKKVKDSSSGTAKDKECLDLGEEMKIQLSPSEDPQRLKFQLKGTALDGFKFVDAEGNPGFDVLEEPQPGYFGAWGFDGRVLWFDVNHKGPGPRAVYRLNAQGGDTKTVRTTEYVTRVKGVRTVNNPIIINKIGDPPAKTARKPAKKAQKKAAEKASKTGVKKAAKTPVAAKKKVPAKKVRAKQATAATKAKSPAKKVPAKKKAAIPKRR